jgi:ribosomal-protein-alanine N-acetyltransferase
MPRIRIETARLLLRNLMPEDIPDLVQMWTDAEVTRFLGGPREAGWLEANFAEEARAADPPLHDQWPVIEKASGQLVGYCGLIEKEIEERAEIELVYAFLPSAWGKGYASEMAQALREHGVQRLHLRRLVALIEPENEASVHVAEAAGFHFERSVRRPAGMMRLYAYEPPPQAVHAAP